MSILVQSNSSVYGAAEQDFVRLKNGYMVVVVKAVGSTPATRNILMSTDNGATWNQISKIVDVRELNIAASGKDNNIMITWRTDTSTPAPYYFYGDVTGYANSTTSTLAQQAIALGGSGNTNGWSATSGAFDSTGVFRMIWSYNSAYSRTYAPAGGGWSGDTLLSGTSGTATYNTSHIWTNDQLVVTTNDQNGSTQGVLCYTWASGTLQVVVVEPNTAFGKPTFPHSVMDGSGVLHLVYWANTNIYYRTSSDGGRTWSAATTIYTTTAATGGPIQISVDSGNAPLVLIQLDNNVNTSGLRYVKKSGSSWTAAAVPANMPEATPYYPGLVGRNFDSGKVHAVYVVYSASIYNAYYASINTNTAPTGPTITAPAANANLNTWTPTVSWAFSDPDAGDTQSAYYVEVWNAAGNAITWSSGWITGAATSYTLPSGAITADGACNLHVYTKDAAGAQSGGSSLLPITIDSYLPNAPTVTIGAYTSKTIPLSWTAFSDPAPSSGFLDCLVYARTWNGSAWVDIAGSPTSVGNVTSYTYTGLTPGVQYQILVRYKDKANNLGNTNTYLVTTKAAPTATINNISSNGYLINQRPILQVVGTEYNGTTVELRIIISKNSNMSSPLADTWASHSAEVGYAGWTTKGNTASGAVNVYMPQVDLGTGIVYVQVQAFTPADGGFNGALSAVMSFTINAPAWPTTVADADTAISKRTIDNLRAQANSVRQARGVATKTWAVPTINDWNNVSPTQVSASHVNELRAAIQDIWTALGKGTISWRNASVTSSLARTGKDWVDLRNNLILC